MKLSWKSRWTILISGALVLGLLITTRFLEPARQGFGTHQQLGLPPCSSLVLFGVKCPACGMTTSWSLVTRGDWAGAAQTNAGGMLLAVIAIAYLPASCYLFSTGRTSRHGWISFVFGASLLVAILLATVQWALRMT